MRAIHRHLLAVMAIVFLTRNLTAQASEVLQTWHSVATDRDLPVSLVQPKEVSPNHAFPLVVYLKGLASPRVGTDSDESILHDFQNDGYLVLTLDYGRDAKARVPFINRDVFELRNQLFHKQLLGQMPIDPAQIFIVPSGCRLRQNVLFYPDPKRPLAMDIIYPSHPVKPVGAIIEFSCDNQNRMGNASLVICSDTILEAEATEGLAVAMADHPVPPPYKGLDAMPDCARKIKAAIRTLRAQGADLGLNGKIAPVGFSRGSGMALMLVTTEGMTAFEGYGEHTNTSSAVQGAVVMSGRFTYLDLLPEDHMIPRYDKAWGPRATNLETWRQAGALDYLDKAVMPLFLTINCTEGPDAQHQMTVLRKRLAELGNDEVFMMDREPRGHKVTLVPELLTAMDAYLKSRVN